MHKAALWQMFAMLLQAFAIFLTGFALLHSADTEHYALFALSQVVQGTVNGLINALCASPLLLLLNSSRAATNIEGDSASANELGNYKSYGMVALGIALLAVIFQFCLAIFLAWPFASASVIALACGFFTVRWYLRSIAQNSKQALVVFSDLLLAAVQLLGTAGLFYADKLNLLNISILLLVSAILSCLPVARIGLSNFSGRAHWPNFRLGYQQQGRPALSGMISVELASNFHSYAIVMLAGAAAFAPIAAAAMFLRPMTIVQNSLVQYFRPHLVRLLLNATTNTLQIRQIVAHILQASIGVWLLNVTAISLISCFAVEWLWPELATSRSFLIALLLTAIWYLLRSLRIHTSALLQSANCFAELAKVTWISSFMLVPLVLLALALGSPLMSLVGAIISELWIVLRLRTLCIRLHS